MQSDNHKLFFFLLKLTCSRSVFCHLSNYCPPQIEKDIHSVRTSSSFLLPLEKRAALCLPCAQPHHISTHYPPGGKGSERHHVKAHTTTYAFPCQQWDFTRLRISPTIRIPTDVCVLVLCLFGFVVQPLIVDLQ